MKVLLYVHMLVMLQTFKMPVHMSSWLPVKACDTAVCLLSLLCIAIPCFTKMTVLSARTSSDLGPVEPMCIDAEHTSCGLATNPVVWHVAGW